MWVKNNLYFVLLVIALAYFSMSSLHAVTKGEVNVYSSRKEVLVRKLFDEFSRQNNIKVNYITDNPNKLIARIENEGELTSADLFICADVSNLVLANSRGLLSYVDSQVLNKAIPEALRNGYWFGLTKRARVIVYAKDRVNVDDLDDYEGLADSKWFGRVLVRSSNHPYNQSLLASIINADGEERAHAWVKGLVANLARKPQGGDTDQIRAVAAGEGDLAIVNSYYYGRILNSDIASDQEIAKKVSVFFPNQNNRGTMMNISGAAVIKHAKNRENAIALLEFMVSPQAQQIYSERNQEYPVVPSVPLSKILSSWPNYKQDDDSLLMVGGSLRTAVQIADEEGWR